MVKLIIIGIVITVVGLFALSAVSKISNQSSSSLNGYSTQDVLDENTAKVEIVGEVNHEGYYYISTSETLGSLIGMAGGVTEDADPNAYNESLVIGVRTTFYIAPVSTSDGVCVDTTINKVNINTAAADALMEVGFNSTQAPNVVDYRINTGLFEALEDILNVKGVGAATFAKVKNKIRLA